MSSEDRELDPLLANAVEAIREEQLAPQVIEKAAGRVWERLAKPEIRGCADFEKLIPAYRAGKLSETRALLVQDHLRECVNCRRALPPAPIEISKPRVSLAGRKMWTWAVAASLLVAAGFAAPRLMDVLPAPAGPRAVVESVEGPVFQVAGGKLIAPGAELGEREGIRTAKDTRATIRLNDGSRVELSERCELSVSRRRSGSTIHLARGSVIVKAAKQRFGHLFVATDDCQVAVKGTTFAVNRGTKGSRVVVLEGEVQVVQAGHKQMLRPGEQVATNSSLSPEPLQNAFAWSSNSGEYVALLNDFAVLQKRIEAVPGPGLRYSSKLLPLVPEGAVIYAAIPNVGTTIEEAHRLFQERLQESKTLRDWWNQRQSGSHGPGLDEIVAKVRGISEYLGDEIVLAVMAKGSGKFRTPILLAEARRPGLQAFLEREVGRDEVRVTMVGNVVVLTPAASPVQLPPNGNFPRTPLGVRVSEAYRNGVGWLFAADMEQIVSQSVTEGRNLESASRLGIGDVKQLVINRRDVSGKTENRAVLTFDHARRGVASWLAVPAPMGALDFVSPDAAFAAAFVVKNPRTIVQELLELARTSKSDSGDHLAEFEAASGISVLNDLAGPLGGEVTFAMDGGVLPQVGWKLAIEVYDPVRLQGTLEKMAAAVNQHNPEAKLRLTSERVSGRTFYLLHAEKAPFDVNYTYVDGYLIAAPDRALVNRAIEQRAAGFTLPRSSGFEALVARDGYTNFSALVYQNLGPTLAGLAGQLNSASEAAVALKANSAPTLIYAYGEPDRIQVASTGGLFGLNPNLLLGLSGAIRSGHPRSQ